jgi:hydroxypyruvate isomerase
LDDQEKVIQEINTSLEVAKKLGCNRIMLLSDILKNDGSVEISTKSKEEKLLRLYENLKALVRIAEKEQILLVIEPLNTIKDHRNYFLDNF